MWKFLTILLFITTIVNSIPIDKDDKVSKEENIPTLATELLPPREDAEVANFGVDVFDDNLTLSRDLQPPPMLDLSRLDGIFIINLYAIKNATGDDPKEILSDDLTEKNPQLLEPIATVLLVLAEEDEKIPVSLDELAKDLEEEGLKVEKIADKGETKVIKVDFDEPLEEADVELINPNKLNRVRRKRSPHGLLSKLLNKHLGGGSYCNTCNQGGGGYPSGNSIGVIPVVVVPTQGGGGCSTCGGGYQQQQPHYQQPTYYQPQPQYQQPQYHQPQYQQPQYQQPQYQPQGGGCSTCGGGNHGSYSQSSAQSSAQSSSHSW